MTSKTAWASRSRSGSDASVATGTVSGSAAGLKCEDLCTASMESVPQMPHELEVKTFRPVSGRTTSGRSWASTTLNVWTPSSSSPAQNRSETSWSGLQMTPSETRKPATRSKSFPGVRMVTEKDRLPSRISSGSSTASTSSRWRTGNSRAWGDPSRTYLCTLRRCVTRPIRHS